MNVYLETPNEEKKELMNDELSTVPSSTVSYIETEHARLRRKQRCIDKKDLNAAILHGTCEPHYWGNRTTGRSNIVRYKYKDIVYIVDKKKKKEVTCYAQPMKLSTVPLPNGYGTQKNHQDAVLKVRADLDCWTSNTVIVIDTSGSMRTSDMWGTRDRLKSVWFSVALDFLAERLESGKATVTDVISIITMGDCPGFICKEVPTTWHLYNKIVSLYNKSIHSPYGVNPEGHGYFLPSLIVAEDLLKRNSNASCAAALVFLSDGAPSEYGIIGTESILQKVESLAKSFGRRLTFTTIGIGDLDDFSVLKSMVDTAKDFGATAEFQLPSMTSTSLGQSFTSVATSLTTPQTEMTDLGTLTQRKIRDVQRESKSKANEVLTEVTDDDFWFYGRDDVTRKVYRDYIDDDGMTQVYYDTVPLQHPDAMYVAFSKGPFGEGAERFAYRFYEIAADGKTILGVPLVAKESRMVLAMEDGMTENEARRQFVRKCITTQEIARRLAVKFNNRLKTNHRVDKDTPQILFLECSIYEMDDETLGKASLLVENKLDPNKWYKWNSNNGMVDGVKKPINEDDETKYALLFKDIGLNEIAQNVATLNLENIEEGSEEEDDEEEDANRKNTKPLSFPELLSHAFSHFPFLKSDRKHTDLKEDTDQKVTKLLFTPAQVAQTFSHFSYLQSDRKRLVCDLQGVYDQETNTLQFSDPAIHYYNPQRSDRICVYGRTDRGRNGIRDFFATHCCEEQGHLCQMLTRGFRSVRTGRNHYNRVSNNNAD